MFVSASPSTTVSSSCSSTKWLLELGPSISTKVVAIESQPPYCLTGDFLEMITYKCISELKEVVEERKTGRRNSRDRGEKERMTVPAGLGAAVTVAIESNGEEPGAVKRREGRRTARRCTKVTVPLSSELAVAEEERKAIVSDAIDACRRRWFETKMVEGASLREKSKRDTVEEASPSP
ncbi:hypothetical protein PIB30_101825 [Stylosanthes scabra]|uniref:Uncharacterized protein n=1 Tax=Stylosanthes scabra TaxID=79078 RepID=A0ABU6TY18_9FABA|nr:hypothetical protein [Stylosanthes scabra]